MTRPRRQSEHEQPGAVGLLRPQVVYEHTSEDVLLQVLQEDSPYPIPAVFDKSISNLKLRLNLKKNWYKSEDCLFYGGRQLLEQNQRVRDVVELANASNDQRYLHVFVKAEDLRSVTVTSHSKHAHRTSALSHAMSKHSLSERSMSERSLCSLQSSTDEVVEHVISPLEHRTPMRETLDYDRPPRPVPAKDDVIHLIIKKTAHVSWQHVGTGQFELTVSVSDTAAMVKERVASANGLLADKHALLYNGFQLDSNKPLAEYGFGKDAVLELVPLEPAESMALTHSEGPRSYSDGSPMLSSPHHSLFMQWQRANSGLRAGRMPALASSGSGGSYLMRDAQNQVVAVFKPVDEEPNAANNPRGFANTQSDYGMRLGILPGEGAFREVAAYVLDHGHRAGVPATAMVYAEMPEDGVLKYGSLQAFVAADCDCEEMGSSAFPMEEVHKIAILDCRLGNTDRNASNILARKEDGTWRLFPIDHGYCLPATLEDITFEWSYWPQAQQPFSEESREYIAALDAEYDLALLRERQIPLRPACARIFRATTLVLKLAAARGFTPYDVAMILQRPADDSPSPLEKLHEEACRLLTAMEDEDDDAAVHNSKELVPFRHRVVTSDDPDDATYISHLKTLVDAYLEERLLDSC